MATRQPIQPSLFLQDLTTEEKYRQIGIRYAAGAGVNALAAECELTPSHLRKILRQQGVSLRKEPVWNNKCTRERIDAILARFAAGDQMLTAIKAGDVGYVQFYEWVKKGKSSKCPLCVYLVKRLDEICDGSTPHSISSRKHTLNESFFKCIDTEEKAWLLGFLATDGNVCKNKISIKLAIRDRAILETIGAVIGSSTPVVDVPPGKGSTVLVSGKSHFIAGTWSSALNIASVKMVADLARHGIAPNKTFTVKPWQGSEELLPAYWRGVIDGDGCIGTCEAIAWRPTGKKRLDWRFALVGSKEMTDGFREFIQQRTGAKGCSIEKGRVFAVSFSGNRLAPKIAALLYSEATIALPRKLALAKQCMALLPQ